MGSRINANLPILFCLSLLAKPGEPKYSSSPTAVDELPAEQIHHGTAGIMGTHVADTGDPSGAKCREDPFQEERHRPVRDDSPLSIPRTK